eukprot:5920434-Pleurochrysis_carterae.AAC.1
MAIGMRRTLPTKRRAGAARLCSLVFRSLAMMGSARRERMKLLESASARTDFFFLRGTLAFELITEGFCNSNMALR